MCVQPVPIDWVCQLTDTHYMGLSEKATYPQLFSGTLFALFG